MKKLIFLVLIIILIVVMCGGCATQRFCPAYQDNYQAMEHRFNKWNGNKPPKKKKSKF